MDVFQAGMFPARVFLLLAFQHGLLFGHIGNQGERFFKQLIPDSEAHPGIAHHVLVPESARELTPLGIGGGQVESVVVCGAADGHRMGNEIPGPGLQVDFFKLVGKGPVGNGCGDEFSLDP